MFGTGQWPSWSEQSSWAPEMHLVDGKYHVYFSMRMNPRAVGGDRGLALGLAISDSPFGPFVDIGRPLRHHPDGVIDATWFRDPV